jgi:hypothetical protein
MEIPTPFLRIDFMRAGNGDLVFCEFTPRPENFDKFNAHVDLVMGREFSSAEARLKDDLLMGKSFSRFLEIYTGGSPAPWRRTKHLTKHMMGAHG